MAQLLLTDQLGRAGIGSDRVQVSSAGVRAAVGAPVTPQTADQLLRRGVDPAGFASRPLVDAMVRDADLVLTATRNHRSQVLERVPLALRRTFTLLEFAAIVAALPPEELAEATDPAAWVRHTGAARGTTMVGEYDIDDPVGGPDEGFAAAAKLISLATQRIAAALVHVS